MSDIYDMTIIGGGPTGLFAGFYAGMRQMKTKIIDSLPILGGQPAVLFPEKTIYDVAGLPKITGSELSHNLIEQVEHFDPTICLNEEVISFDKGEDDIFSIQTNTGTTHHSKAVIITVGGGAFQQRSLNLPDGEKYEQHNLHYILKDLDYFSGKDVVITGGGDSAVDWALALETIAKSVTLVHRRNKFRAMEASVNQLKQTSARILTPYQPESLIGNGHTLDAMLVKETRGDKLIKLEADEFIVSYGVKSSLGPLAKWPLDMKDQKIIVNEKMETSVPGLFAAGDITSYPSKIDLLATGFGEAPIAINHASKYLNPNARVQPIQSTTLKLD